MELTLKIQIKVHRIPKSPLKNIPILFSTFPLPTPFTHPFLWQSNFNNTGDNSEKMTEDVETWKKEKIEELSTKTTKRTGFPECYRKQTGQGKEILKFVSPSMEIKKLVVVICTA